MCILFDPWPNPYLEKWRCTVLPTLQTALATFFLKESTQTLFRLRESPVLPREREVLLSQHTHTPLSLSLSVYLLSFCSARAHTSLYLSRSLRLSAQFLFSTSTHISLSLSASAQFLFSVRVHTHLSLSHSLLSTCTHTHTSLSLSASPQFLFSAAEKSRA